MAGGVVERGRRVGTVRGRWAVLVAFAVLVVATQMLWLTFAPVSAAAAAVWGVSPGAVGDLAAVQPVLFVLLAVPAGRWTDRDLPRALAVGAVLTAVGAGVRVAEADRYVVVLAGQVVLSVGQPLVLNASTAVAARWFPPGARTGAISVAVAAQFVGVLVAATTGEALVGAGGVGLLVRVHAVVALVGAVGLVAALGLVPAAYRTEGGRPAGALAWLVRDRLTWQLAVLLFVGVGVFNAMATWLDPILVALGRPGVAGPLIAVATGAGIVGAAVVPGLAARWHRRRSALLATTVVTVVVFAVLVVVQDPVVMGVLLAVEGFFLLAGMPVALDWSELHSGADRAGTATGLLMLAGNLGGAVLVVVVQVVLADPRVALATIAALTVPGVVVAARLPGARGVSVADSRGGREALP